VPTALPLTGARRVPKLAEAPRFARDRLRSNLVLKLLPLFRASPNVMNQVPQAAAVIAMLGVMSPRYITVVRTPAVADPEFVATSH
jgi:hypothetical protein